MQAYANPTSATVAWIVGGVVLGGGLLYLAFRKKPAASGTKLAILTTPITPAPTPQITPAVDMCQPVSKVKAFAASIGKSAFWSQSQSDITADPGHSEQLPYVADTCSFYTWAGTGAHAHWVKDDATNALFADWLAKLQAQLRGVPSGVEWVRS